MASPTLPTHDQVPNPVAASLAGDAIPVDASFAGDTQASAAGFPTSLALAEQSTTHSMVSLPVDASVAGETQSSAAGFPTSLPLAKQATTQSIVPLPVDVNFAGEIQATAAGFPASLPLAEQVTTHSIVPLPVDASFAGETQTSAAGFPTSLPFAEQSTPHSISCMMEAEQFVPWSELRPELLSLVLKGLPSLADRVCLRAVCQPWRSNTIPQTLPFPFPWLTLPDGTFLSIPGGEVHRMPVPDGACCHGSIDNSLFLMGSDGACSLLNPFSKTTLELPNLVTLWQRDIDGAGDRAVSYKLVAPSSLGSSPKCLAAALIIRRGYSDNLCIIKPQVANYSFKPFADPYLVDFAFFDGRLCMVSELCKLFIVDLSENHESFPNIICAIDSAGDLDGVPQYLNREEFNQFKQYLVESGGKLLMVLRFMRSSGGFRDTDSQTVGFKVLEADMRTNPGQWRTVSDLGGHALFLGKQSSKSLPAEECKGSQGDCIYFICDYPCPEASANPLRDSGIYNMRSGKIVPLCSGTPAVPQRQAGQWALTWYFPPVAVVINPA